MIPLLGAAVILLLGLKAVATLILLPRPPAVRLATGEGRRLWWATKVTPVLAVPCLIAIALLGGDRSRLPLYCGLMAFVLLAVPWKIWRHRAMLFGHGKGPESPPALR